MCVRIIIVCEGSHRSSRSRSNLGSSKLKAIQGEGSRGLYLVEAPCGFLRQSRSTGLQVFFIEFVRFLGHTPVVLGPLRSALEGSHQFGIRFRFRSNSLLSFINLLLFLILCFFFRKSQKKNWVNCHPSTLLHCHTC